MRRTRRLGNTKSLKLAAGLMLVAGFPAFAGDVNFNGSGAITDATASQAIMLTPLTQNRVTPEVLSDGMGTETGEWQTKVQLVYDTESQRIERRLYTYFD